jgi:ribosomal protein L7/L12
MQSSRRFYLLDVEPGTIETVVKRLTHKNSLEQGMDATFWLLAALFLVVLASSWTDARNNDGVRLARLERKVDLILRHLGLDSNQDVNPQIIELMQSGRKIQAIKLYRQQTGVGLKEAKDYVESLQIKGPAKSFQPPP